MGWILWLSMALDRFFASTYTKIFWDEVIRLAEVITLNDWVIRIKKAIANVADLDVERQAGGELDTLVAYHFAPVRGFRMTPVWYHITPVDCGEPALIFVMTSS